MVGVQASGRANGAADDALILVAPEDEVAPFADFVIGETEN